jgi:hypothetical protein
MRPNSGRKQAQRLLPALGPCVGCGGAATERHHVDGDPRNNAPANVAQLCGRCHTLAHRPTHCKHGHPFDQENTYVTPAGYRHCRACKRERQLRYQPQRTERQRERRRNSS